MKTLIRRLRWGKAPGSPGLWSRLRIPPFFKSKKFFVLAGLSLLFFFFTPVSFYQAGRRLEAFINGKALEGVVAFEKQTGLKIQWESLKLRLLPLSVELEDVSVLPLNTANFKKIQELRILDGLQRLKKIKAKPSLYSLLFKKRIFLSRLILQDGEICLKTAPFFNKKRGQSKKNISFPVGKLLIKNTRLNIKRNGQSLLLSRAGAELTQRKTAVFDFKLSVGRFQFPLSASQNQAPASSAPALLKKGEDPLPHPPAEFSSRSAKALTKPLPRSFCERGPVPQEKTKAGAKKTEQKKGRDILQEKRDKNADAFSFFAAGRLRNTGAWFDRFVLKGENFESQTRRLEILLKDGGLQQLILESSGALPSALLNKGFVFFGRAALPLDSLISYSVNIQYRRQGGFKGVFELSGQNGLFKDILLRRFSLKGRLNRFALIADSGSAALPAYGSLSLNKAEFFFKRQPFSFAFSVSTVHLSSEGIRQVFFPHEDFPLKTRLTGQVDCEGEAVSYLHCAIKGISEKTAFLLQDGEDLLSVHDMNWSATLSLMEEDLDFAAQGEKPDSAIDFKGRLEGGALKASYSFSGRLGEDLKIKAPFPLKGQVMIQNGAVTADGSSAKARAVFSSPLLEISGFKLKNISGAFQFQNNRLIFSDIKGFPGHTSWKAGFRLDFDQERLSGHLNMPFLDLRDGMEAIEEPFPPPFPLKGTGSLSLSLDYPWAFPERKSFHLKGGLFNVRLGGDFFQQADFDFVLKKGKGQVRSFFLKKGRGRILGSGSFGPDFSLDGKVTGQNLSLEGFAFLNQILPLNQTGDLRFDMKVKGTLARPVIQGGLFADNMLLYSYPAGNSRLNLSLTREGVSFSGHIIDRIFVENFVYPFSGKSQIAAKGRFQDLDFVQILLAKDRREQRGDYSSKISGLFSLKREDDGKEGWLGTAKISDFMISRSPNSIKSRRPFSLFFQPGRWSVGKADFYHNEGAELSLDPMEEGKLLITGQSDLALFSVFLPFMEEWEGQVKGRLLADNNLLRLNPAGSVRVEKALFLMKFLPEFSGIEGDLILSKNNIFIKSLKARAGGGRVEGEGSVFYDFSSPPHLNLNLKFFKARLNIPEDFKTRGSGDISIRGEKPPYLISGNYLIESGLVTKEFSQRGSENSSLYDFSFAEEGKEGESSLFHLKWGVKTLQPLVVENSFIRSALQGETAIYGPLEALRMKGRFHLSSKEGENLIFFRGREFKIRSGSILFEDSPPENPYLNVSAFSSLKETVRDPLEDSQERVREYRIFLSLKGPSKDPVFSLKSSPPLNEKEIISLLALGVGYRHFDTHVEQNISDYSYHIGSLILERFLNRELKRASGWDVRLPSYISSSNETDWKIVLSRNWFKKWKTSFSRTLEKSQSDARLKYSLNPGVSLTAFWENNTEEANREEEGFEDSLGFDFEFDFDF